ncbi:MAG: SUMF1/EgtB/PvdO family nonheme iron enzyme [Hyphomicrobiaceae bacterium]
MFDIVFWLLVGLIGLVAFAIEGGLATRHRRVMLVPLFAALGSAISMMFFVEDKSEFKFEKIVKQVGPGGKRKVVQRNRAGADDEEGVEIVEINEEVERIGRDGTTDLLSEDGGLKDCPTCPVMIAIGAGYASVGSPPAEPGHGPDEAPVKRVAVAAFMIGKYEITVGQYAAFVEDSGHVSAAACMINGAVVPGANWKKPGFAQSKNHPVVCIASTDMDAYVEWLRLKTGRRYRLPSESEWEYVARAGGTQPYWTGPAITPDKARFGVSAVPALLQKTSTAPAKDADKPGTVTAGHGGPNAFNLFDVHGNAWEIVADCWQDDHASLPAGGKAITRIPCPARVAKGGGWSSDADRLRAAARQPFDAGLAANTVGFRLARDP